MASDAATLRVVAERLPASSIFETPGTGFRISPGDPDVASLADIVFKSQVFRAGEAASFSVVVRDIYGNPRLENNELKGGDGMLGKLTLTLVSAEGRDPVTFAFKKDPAEELPEGQVELSASPPNPETGEHVISFTPTFAGKIRMQIEVQADGSIIFQEAAVSPGPLTGAASEVRRCRLTPPSG